MRSVILLIGLILVIGAWGCGINDKEVYLSGMVDIENVKTAVNGPLLLAVTNTADLGELEANPATSILGVFGIDADDPYYHIDLKEAGIQPEETIYVFAFVDNDFNNVPTPTLGDFIGFYIDRKTYKLDYTLKEGQNRGIDISVNRQIRDFDATIVYAIDEGSVEYGNDYNTLKAEEIVLAVHENGVDVSLTSSGNYDIKIDPDYILGFARYQPPVFDNYSGEERLVPFENPRIMEILTAIHVNIEIKGDMLDGNVYLVSIIDENGNGEIEAGDDIGYYEEKKTLESETCYTVPGYGEICAQPGDYYYPKTIEIYRGENRDTSVEPLEEPYWIMYRNVSAPIPIIK